MDGTNKIINSGTLFPNKNKNRSLAANQLTIKLLLKLLPPADHQKTKTMIRRLIYMSIAAIVFSSCQGQNPVSNELQPMTNGQTSTNPYYSRTDTTKLSVSDEEWQRVLPCLLHKPRQ